MNVVYRCELSSDDVNDFLSNYSDKATRVDDIIFSENTAFVTLSYDKFKKSIDGNALTWDSVLYTVERDINGLKFYTLYIEVQG